MKAKPKIYLSTYENTIGTTIGFALAQDGTMLCEFPYHCAAAALKALLLDQRLYRKHYINGFQIICDPVPANAGFLEAMRLHRDIRQDARRDLERGALMAGVGLAAYIAGPLTQVYRQKLETAPMQRWRPGCGR